MIKKLQTRRYAEDKSGQFAILFAITASAIMMFVATTINTISLHKTKSKLYNIVDSAVLAGAVASEMRNTERVKIVEDFIKNNSNPELYSQIKGQPLIKFDDFNREVTVRMEINTATLFPGLLGQDPLSVGAVSVASYMQPRVNPVSISLVLDVSGSMAESTRDGQQKLDALKESVNLMFEEIEAEIKDPAQLNRTMRTGMASYNRSLQARTSMNAGWRNVSRAVNRLNSGGGTNSTPALAHAHGQIIQDRKYRLANDPNYNPNTMREFIIFMTDGDNNQSSWDQSSRDVCERMKGDNIEVFTIAFAAPDKGRLLLKECASQADQGERFFDAEDSATFKDAFRQIGREIVERGVRIKA